MGSASAAPWLPNFILPRFSISMRLWYIDQFEAIPFQWRYQAKIAISFKPPSEYLLSHFTMRERIILTTRHNPPPTAHRISEWRFSITTHSPIYFHAQEHHLNTQPDEHRWFKLDRLHRCLLVEISSGPARHTILPGLPSHLSQGKDLSLCCRRCYTMFTQGHTRLWPVGFQNASDKLDWESLCQDRVHLGLRFQTRNHICTGVQDGLISLSSDEHWVSTHSVVLSLLHLVIAIHIVSRNRPLS